MKNITFIIGIMGNGGAERVISILSDELVKKNINVNLITIYGDKKDYEINNNVNHIPLICKSKVKIFRPIERIIKLRYILKLNKSDVIISFLADVNIHTLISSLFLNTKVIVSERNDPRNDPKSKKIRYIRDIVYNIADGVVFQTEDAKKYFDKSIQAKSIIIENPLKNGLPNVFRGKRKKEIVSVSRLNVQKNLPMLIEAFSKIESEFSEYKLVIYGEGPLRKILEDDVKERGLIDKVSFPGFEKDIHNKILESSMFVLSSNYEGISNSMIEALAIGVPVISTDCPVGGARRFIKSYENGILVPVGDCEKLYESMKDLIINEELSIKLSNNSISIREELSAKKICGKWIDYITYIEGNKNES